MAVVTLSLTQPTPDRRNASSIINEVTQAIVIVSVVVTVCAIAISGAPIPEWLTVLTTAIIMAYVSRVRVTVQHTDGTNTSG